MHPSLHTLFLVLIKQKRYTSSSLNKKLAAKTFLFYEKMKLPHESSKFGTTIKCSNGLHAPYVYTYTSKNG